MRAYVGLSQVGVPRYFPDMETARALGATEPVPVQIDVWHWNDLVDWYQNWED